MSDTDRTEEDIREAIATIQNKKYYKKSAIPPEEIYTNYRPGTGAGRWEIEKEQKGADIKYIRSDKAYELESLVSSQQEKHKELRLSKRDHAKDIYRRDRAQDMVKKQMFKLKDLKAELSEKNKQIESLEKQLLDSRCCGNCKTYEVGWCPDHEIDIDGAATCNNWKPRS
ncbi:MAG: hypothetical protein JRJ00_00100 [Deltaproteobacteria bacterium]|nr:hypothetical protein [Deltaproteobacteria bacterium]